MIAHASIRELKSALDAGDAHVIDVRETFEYAAGHVPGAVNLPMHLIPLRAQEVPSGSNVFIICESGNRSWQVTAFLHQRGIEAVNVEGGTGAWRSAGFPITQGAAA